MLPLITVFGKDIGTYAVLSIIGLSVCAVLAFFECKKKSILIDDIILLLLAIGGGLLIGGHILYGLTHIKALFALFGLIGKIPVRDFFVGLGTVFGGMVFYGGLLGAIAAAGIYSKFSKAFKEVSIFDLLGFSIPLFHTFGRVGCFLGGCCYGVESELGFTFTGNSIVPELNGVSRFPVQLTEAALNLCLFILLYTLFKKGAVKGRLLVLYLSLYAPIRFILEFFRGDEIRGFLFSLSTSQWVSIGIMIFVLVYVIVAVKNKKSRRNAVYDEVR